MNLNKEKERLEKIAQKFSMAKGFNARLEKYRALEVAPLIRGDTILEVGCADGLMVSALSDYFPKAEIVGIDGSKKMIERASKLVKKKKVSFIHSLAEEYKPESKFDTVIMVGILEHIKDPLNLLKLAKQWVKQDGYLIILVPNANSVHRRVGKIMGLIKDVHELNESDKLVGHRRVYDRELLFKDLKNAGLKILKAGGLFLKPLANAQIEDWSDNLFNAFYEIGKELSDYTAEIYVQCQLKT